MNRREKIKVEITEEQQETVNAYALYVKQNNLLRKMRPGYLYQFLTYLNDYGIDMYAVTLSDTENYRYYLATLTDDDGTLKYTTGSTLARLAMISGFYEYLKKMGKVFINAFQAMDPMRNPRVLPRNVPTEDKLQKILKYLRDFNKGCDLKEKIRLYRTHVIAEVMYSTGARINEILKLTKDDVDLLQGTVLLRDSKTGKERTGFLNSYAEKILRIYIEDFKEQVVMYRTVDTRLLFGGFVRAVKMCNDMLQKAGIKCKVGSVTSHILRHAFGYHFLKAGCDIRYIQEFLGHANIDTTQIYTKVSKEDLRGVLDTYHPRQLKKGSKK